MATAAEIVEIDMHSTREGDDAVVNGDVSGDTSENEEVVVGKGSHQQFEEEDEAVMEIDERSSEGDEGDHDRGLEDDNVEEDESMVVDEDIISKPDEVSNEVGVSETNSEVDEVQPCADSDSEGVKDKDAVENEQKNGDDCGGDGEADNFSDKNSEIGDDKSDSNSKANSQAADEVMEVHEIIDDDDEEDGEHMSNGLDKNETIELNDDSGGEGDGDVMIIEDSTPPKENGSISKRSTVEVIELDTTPVKKVKKLNLLKSLTPRRSSRNVNKQKSYVESDKEDSDKDKVATPRASESEESDIEEVMPQDPLAVGSDKVEIIRKPKPTITPNVTSTIVVKDTKRLVEIAAKSNTGSSPGGSKKEPTLVIIDTNSILSGRGPIPVKKPASTASTPTTTTSTTSSSSSSSNNYPPVLPVALPAQGMYPPNMRATITPIPMNAAKIASSLSTSNHSPNQSHNQSHIRHSPATPNVVVAPPSPAPIAPVLPTLTDDMFVVEAPSFIVPYVYEKPPVTDFKDFVKELKERLLKEQREREEKEKEKEKKLKKEGDKDGNDTEENESGKSKENNQSDDDDVVVTGDSASKKIKDKDEDFVPENSTVDTAGRKPYSYFESPLGKFFSDIGFNLVQESVQNDLLRQQKRKREREGGHNATTNKNIYSIIKNLEYSKENNEPFKLAMKKCEFCNFKTESMLVMSHHLETPHTKNYVYKCNFCAYEVRSPHDILFHMEAEHTVRGRLERAPAFHQCPNCPFEDNQKGKLSRHLVACTRKFKPDKNLEPPIDWEPPAKIPRVPKSRQGLNVSAYHAMKSNQFQFLQKMQQMNNVNPHGMHRGRGRPTMIAPVKPQMMRPNSMVYKQTMSGGSVLVPTNYQLSGNQVYQVLGGQELGGRLGHPGHMAFLPNIPSASSTVTIQQNQQQQQQPQQQQQQQTPKAKSMHQPSISITPLPRASSTPNTGMASKPGDTNSKNSFVICEICDGYIKDLEQLRNHMQWIHKVKIHPKMIYNRPPLNCQKCQFRFFTDQGLERHLLGSHGLVTSSMQDAANKSKDAGRCPVCGRVYQWKLLNHVARDHNMTLKPAHLSYKCTVCTATFGMYKQFENHVYSAHSVVAKRVMDKKNASPATASKPADVMKPLKINDEITIIPQPPKSSSSKDGSPSTSRNTPSTSKNAESTSNSSAEKTSSNDAKATD